MRILYLHQGFRPPGVAGGNRSNDFARRWVRRGHEVVVITLAGDRFDGYAGRRAGRRSVLDVEGVEVRVVQGSASHHLSYRRRLAAFGRFAAAASLEALRIPRPDVVFATSTPLTIAVPGMWTSAVHRCPMVFEVRDLWPEVPIALGVLRNRAAQAAARWLERAAYHSSAHVIALSPGMRDGVVRAGYPAERVSVIPNLSDVALFGGGTMPEDPEYRRLLGPGPLVVYTGRIGLVNGLDQLVALARETRALAPEVRFVVFGDGKEKDAVERAAREAGLLDSTLRILRTVPKSELPRVLATADVATSFVRNVPALWDNSANKFFDALAAGKPVLINYGGWQADVLRESGAGIAIPPDDARTGARMLVELLRDRERMRRAGAAAAQLARTAYDVDRLAEQALSILERAVAAHHSEREAFHSHG